ncbi:MAG: hypothetical protein ACQESR_29020 [Planctomycetota bacterium]
MRGRVFQVEARTVIDHPPVEPTTGATVHYRAGATRDPVRRLTIARRNMG